eukprot:TRINITY_DN2298_c0_g1_i6.p1 TRINITY_DN2298_c0_g1~~TRINITY_DN2298_c0_g1_i6.p1  ORF type:complete len:424 (-),score=49.27 TRINITY_DN2298_c0_g1_i6:102-1373(-)
MAAGMGKAQKPGNGGWYLETNVKPDPLSGDGYRVVLHHQQNGKPLKGLLLYAVVQDMMGGTQERAGKFLETLNNEEVMPLGFAIMEDCAPKGSTITHITCESHNSACKVSAITFRWNIDYPVESVTFKALIVVENMSDWYVLDDVTIISEVHRTTPHVHAQLTDPNFPLDFSHYEWNVYDGYYLVVGNDVPGFTIAVIGRDACRAECEKHPDCTSFTVRKKDGLCSIKTQFTLEPEEGWLSEHKQAVRSTGETFFVPPETLVVRRRADLTKISRNSVYSGSIMINGEDFREAIPGKDITEALKSLTEVTGDLGLMQLPSDIDKVNFLSNLKTVGGVLDISNNDYLCGIEFPNLQSIGSIFSLTWNRHKCFQSLGTFGGKSGVTIGSELHIVSNVNLPSSSIQALTASLITTNPKLEVNIVNNS